MNTSIFWVINSLNINDLEAVNNIDKQSPSPWTPAQLEGELFRPDGWQLAGRENTSGPLQGFLFARNFAGEAEILRIAVNERYRRKGLGTQLLDSLLQTLLRKKITACHLELRAGNTQAVKLYEKSDFVMTGVRKKYYTDPVDDAILMTRTI